MKLLSILQIVACNQLDVLSRVVTQLALLDVVLDLVKSVNGHGFDDVDQVEPVRGERILVVATLIELLL